MYSVYRDVQFLRPTSGRTKEVSMARPKNFKKESCFGVENWWSLYRVRVVCILSCLNIESVLFVY